MNCSWDKSLQPVPSCKLFKFRGLVPGTSRKDQCPRVCLPIEVRTNGRNFFLGKFPKNPKKCEPLDRNLQEFQELGYASRSCHLFIKFRKALINSPAENLRNSNRNFWWNGKCPSYTASLHLLSSTTHVSSVISNTRYEYPVRVIAIMLP